MFEWANVSFGKTETWRLAQQMAKFAGEKGVTNLRLWGKILGREGDYYVFEGSGGEGEEEEGEETDPVDLEAPGATGVNQLTYWVCPGNDITTMTQLPKVTRQHIVSSRLLRKLFTGSLGAEVSGYPPFNGTEAHYLRATIARITAETLIAPAGIYKKDEDDGMVIMKDDENEDVPTHEDLIVPDNWVQLQAPINAMGRQSAAPEVQNDDGDDVAPPGFEDIEAAEPLEAIAGEGAWSLRSCPSSKGPGALAVLRSMSWPGAVSVGFGRRFCNIYVGNGIPYAATSYTPPELPEINEEFTPPEEEMNLVEQEDVLVDPTPPVEEDAEGEDDE